MAEPASCQDGKDRNPGRRTRVADTVLASLSATVTRRRALAIGGAAGLTSLLPIPRGAWARGRPGLHSFGLDVPDRALTDGSVLHAPRRFDLVGVRGDALVGSGLEVRVRRRGADWSPWVPIGAGVDHAPDHPLHLPASDPVWAGGADELQLRAKRELAGLRLKFVSVPAAGSGIHAQAAQAQAFQPASGAAPTIIERADWGAAQAPPRALPAYGTVELAFVHHTVNANDYKPEDSARIVLGIAKYHIDHNGWNDIGYNFLVDRYGQVFEGRAGGIDQAVIGAQAGGWNSKSTGIANIGTYTSTPLGADAEAVLARLIAWKLSLHAVPLSGSVRLISGGGTENRYGYGTAVTLNRVSGHRDGCKTDCPGATLYGQLDELRGRVAALSGSFAVIPRVTLAVAATQVLYGDAARCSGRLSQPDGTPIVGAAVSVQKQVKGGEWVPVAKAKTKGDGSWAAPVTWRKTGVLRAVAKLADSTSVRSAQTTVTVLTAVRVSTPAMRSRVHAPGSVIVAGTVGPSGNVTIHLERQLAGGRWVPAGNVSAKLKGHNFSAKIRLTKPALYRLVARGGTATHPSVAPTFYVRAVRKAV
jgi:hypothetical protein